MPKIREPLYWDENNCDHVWASHHVSTDEVEEVVFGIEGEDTTFRMIRDGDFHIVLGATGAGRLLVLVGEYVADGRFRVFAARDMNHNEKRRYRRG